MLGLIVDNKLSFEKHIAKLCQANKKILNIRESQILRKCFCGFSIYLCASNLDILPKKYIFQNAENPPENTESHLSFR